MESGALQTKSATFSERKNTAESDFSALNGLFQEKREKFRIRYYGTDTSFIRLEKKSKISGLCHKEQARITDEECQRIIDGDTAFLLSSENNLLKERVENSKIYTRKQLADYLELTIDTLRNWELNGLLRIKRKENGYRVYNEDDIKRIKIIRSLRCVNFSLSAILRLLRNLDNDNSVDIKHIINTPKEDEDIVSVCDKLLTSLENAKDECNKMIIQIKKMKKINIPV